MVAVGREPPPGPVAIIAGGGRFPLEIADAARMDGRSVSIVGLRGFGERSLERYPVVWADMLDPERILGALKAVGPACVVLAGSVTHPGPRAITAIFAAYRNRDHIARVLSSGDDRILRGVVAFIEDAGFHVVGAQDVAPGLLAAAGPLGGRDTTEAEAADIARGRALLDAISPFDVGQAVVVSAGRILAVEGPEGTDAMLDRVYRLQQSRPWRRARVTPGEGGVLVKGPKIGQDTRVDLPAIGPRTVAMAHRAGLTAVAVAAGGVILIDRRDTVTAAKACGVALVGYGAAGVPA